MSSSPAPDVSVDFERLDGELERDLVEARCQAIRYQRSSILQQIPQIRQKHNIYIEPDDTSEDVTPQQLQYVWMLMEIVYQNCDKIVGVLASQRSHQRLFAVKSAIPALFGFFTSEEHLIESSKFFEFVFKSRNSGLIEECLGPLLSSPLVMRFVENLYFGVFEQFIADAIVLNDRNIVKKKLGEFIQKLEIGIKKGLTLLPSGLIDILKCVHCDRIFRDQLLIPQLKLFVRSREYCSSEWIVDELKNHVIRFQMPDRAAIDVPGFYRDFTGEYRDYLLTPMDVDCLIDLLNRARCMTDSISRFKRTKYFPRIDYKPFWMKWHYCPGKPSEEEVMKPVLWQFDERQESCEASRVWESLQNRYRNDVSKCGVLECLKQDQRLMSVMGDKFGDLQRLAEEQEQRENAERGRRLEQFIVTKTNLRGVEQWRDMIIDYFGLYVHEYVTGDDGRIQDEHGNTVLFNSERGFSICGLECDGRQTYFRMMTPGGLCPIRNNMAMLKTVTDIDELWQRLASYWRTKVKVSEMMKMQPRLSRHLFQLIQSLRVVPFPDMLEQLMITMRTIMRIGTLAGVDSVKLAMLVIAMCEHPGIISEFLIIDCFTMKPKHRNNLFVSDDAEAWNILERAIENMIEESEDMVEAFSRFRRAYDRL